LFFITNRKPDLPTFTLGNQIYLPSTPKKTFGKDKTLDKNIVCRAKAALDKDLPLGKLVARDLARATIVGCCCRRLLFAESST
jgi:hypothetical protein